MAEAYKFGMNAHNSDIVHSQDLILHIGPRITQSTQSSKMFTRFSRLSTFVLPLVVYGTVTPVTAAPQSAPGGSGQAEETSQKCYSPYNLLPDGEFLHNIGNFTCVEGFKP